MLQVLHIILANLMKCGVWLNWVETHWINQSRLCIYANELHISSSIGKYFLRRAGRRPRMYTARNFCIKIFRRSLSFHFLSQEIYTARNFHIDFSSLLSFSDHTASNSGVKIPHQSLNETFYQDIKTVFNEYLIRIFISVFSLCDLIFMEIKF